LFGGQIHDIESPDYGALKRVQGVAIPRQLPVYMPFSVTYIFASTIAIIIIIIINVDV